MSERKGLPPPDINRRNKVHEFRPTHIEMELRAKVSEHIVKQDVSVSEMCDVLKRIVKSWEPVIFEDENFNKGEA